MKTSLLVALSIFISVAAQAGHHEDGGMKSAAVIGTVYSDDGTPNQLLAGNTDTQQIWVNYIQAHNDRDLDGIAAVNADDWEGYLPDGGVIKGNSTHIEFLKDWFTSSENPKWKVMWMIANDGATNGGATETWLTTGNDITFNDGDGNQVTEHHVHDIHFVGNKIKRINVYSRLSQKD